MKINHTLTAGQLKAKVDALAALSAAKIRALLDGRFNASFEDYRGAAHPALRHRLILNFEAEAEGITTDMIIGKILEGVPRNVETIKA